MQKQTVTRRQRPVSRLRQLALRLVIVVLILLILWLLNKVNWVFSPLQQFFSIIGGPVVLAGVFYYLMNPLVDRLEKSKFHVHRTWTIIGLFAVIFGIGRSGRCLGCATHPGSTYRVNQRLAALLG